MGFWANPFYWGIQLEGGGCAYRRNESSRPLFSTYMMIPGYAGDSKYVEDGTEALGDGSTRFRIIDHGRYTLPPRATFRLAALNSTLLVYLPIVVMFMAVKRTLEKTALAPTTRGALLPTITLVLHTVALGRHFAELYQAQQGMDMRSCGWLFLVI